MNKVKIDKDLCIRCGACVSTAPDNFDFNPNEGFVEVINETVNDAVITAQSLCPTGAIIIYNEES